VFAKLAVTCFTEAFAADRQQLPVQERLLVDGPLFTVLEKERKEAAERALALAEGGPAGGDAKKGSAAKKPSKGKVTGHHDDHDAATNHWDGEYAFVSLGSFGTETSFVPLVYEDLGIVVPSAAEVPSAAASKEPTSAGNKSLSKSKSKLAEGAEEDAEKFDVFREFRDDPRRQEKTKNLVSLEIAEPSTVFLTYFQSAYKNENAEQSLPDEVKLWHKNDHWKLPDRLAEPVILHKKTNRKLHAIVTVMREVMPGNLIIPQQHGAVCGLFVRTLPWVKELTLPSVAELSKRPRMFDEFDEMTKFFHTLRKEVGDVRARNMILEKNEDDDYLWVTLRDNLVGWLRPLKLAAFKKLVHPALEDRRDFNDNLEAYLANYHGILKVPLKNFTETPAALEELGIFGAGAEERGARLSAVAEAILNDPYLLVADAGALIGVQKFLDEAFCEGPLHSVESQAEAEGDPQSKKKGGDTKKKAEEAEEAPEEKEPAAPVVPPKFFHEDPERCAAAFCFQELLDCGVRRFGAQFLKKRFRGLWSAGGIWTSEEQRPPPPPSRPPTPLAEEGDPKDAKKSKDAKKGANSKEEEEDLPPPPPAPWHESLLKSVEISDAVHDSEEQRARIRAWFDSVVLAWEREQGTRVFGDQMEEVEEPADAKKASKGKK